MKRRGQKFRLQDDLGGAPVRAQPRGIPQHRQRFEQNNSRREAELMDRAENDVNELFQDGMTSHKTFQSISRLMSLYSAVQNFVN